MTTTLVLGRIGWPQPSSIAIVVIYAHVSVFPHAPLEISGIIPEDDKKSLISLDLVISK